MKISKIFKKHYISSIIAFITVIMSIAQIWIATIDKNKELELAKITHKDNFIQKQNQIDKTWQYNMTEFMAKHRESIFSDDLKVRQNMRDIMLVSFPMEIISPIFNNLSKILDDEYKQEWVEAKNVAKRIGQPTVYMQIEEGFPNKILDLIADTIAEGDVSFEKDDEYIEKGLTNGDVRYFNEFDRDDAEYVRQGLIDTACSEGYKLSLTLMPMINNLDRNIPGTIEVWLSSKSVTKIPKNELPCY